VLTEQQLDRKNEIESTISTKMKNFVPLKPEAVIPETKVAMPTPKRPPTIPYGWDNGAKHINHAGADLTIGMMKRKLTMIKCIVRLDSGEWPSDDDLFGLCDDTKPPEARHFGGAVQKLQDNIKHITVYTD